MSESDATFDLIGKQHAALAELITKNAWRIAGGLVAGLVFEIDGKRIPMEHLILRELQQEVNREIHP
jgi:hypothetical protein